MANYSTDTDLALLEADLSQFDNLEAMHTQAKAEIDRRLRNLGFDTEDDIAYLSAETLEDLKIPSSYFVLYLAFNSISVRSGDAYQIKADSYFDRFIEAFRTTKIKRDSSGSGEPDKELYSGEVVLG